MKCDSKLEPLKARKEIHNRLECEYFFCTSQGRRIHPSNLRQRVCLPLTYSAMSKARTVRRMVNVWIEHFREYQETLGKDR